MSNRTSRPVRDSWVFAGRSVKRYVRDAEMVVNTVAFPVLLLLTLVAVFSTAVEAFDDGPYAQRLVPMLVVCGVMFGSVGTAVGFFTDLRDGYMDRVRSLPVAAAAPLAGAVLAEVVRAMSSAVVVAALGHAFGFRFANGPAGLVGFAAVVALAALSVVWIGLAIATVARSQEALAPPLGALFLVLLFFSRGMVPLDAYPGWAQPVVRFNPATAYVTALDRLARGGELTAPILAAVAWSAGLIAVCGTLASRALRRSRRT